MQIAEDTALASSVTNGQIVNTCFARANLTVAISKRGTNAEILEYCKTSTSFSSKP